MKLSLIGFLATAGSVAAFQQVAPNFSVANSKRSMGSISNLRAIAMDPTTTDGIPSLNNNSNKGDKQSSDTGAMMDLTGVVFSVSFFFDRKEK